MEEQYEESLLWIRFAQMIGAEIIPDDEDLVDAPYIKEDRRPKAFAIALHGETFWSDEIYQMHELLFEELIPFMESQGFPVWHVGKTLSTEMYKPFFAGFQEGITSYTTDETHIAALGYGDSMILAAIIAAVKALKRKEERDGN